MTGSFSIRRGLFWIILIANAALLLLVLSQRGSMRVGLPRPASEPPILATLRPFSLIRESGEAFSSRELEGSAWVANFIFTRCPNQCPMMTARLAALQRSLPSKLKIVSITVDPAHDTADALKAYAEKFKTDPGRWFFLTGDPGVLRQIREEYK